MESLAKHNRTVKRPVEEQEALPPANQVIIPSQSSQGSQGSQVKQLNNLLDDSARDAFRRQWHRLERGLRLNRLRMYVEEMSPQCSFTLDEKTRFFAFLSNALDRKLLNTHKIVDYDMDTQKIRLIRGLEVRRISDGTCKWGFTRVKKDGTRRKKVQQATEQSQPSQPSQPSQSDKLDDQASGV
jgi:hypothetical protein